jgi:rod shape-determining protein MreC
MKSKIVIILILVIVLLILTDHKNSGLKKMMLDFINPVRVAYREVTTEIESKSQTYIFQKNKIDELRQENRVLRKYLFDQTNFIKQLSNIYDTIPSLQKLPYRNVALVDTISYVKLNKFDQILLSNPQYYELNSSRVYGLIQKEQVAGIARLEDGHLYGYLVSNPECSFSVIVGEKRFPGVAFGKGHNRLLVKFIPKWADVNVNDYVQTSGLDKIFFANVPVGVVKSVTVEESYKVATVEVFADVIHPNIFFLILNSKPYLASYYDKDKSFPKESEYCYSDQPPLMSDENISSIPITNQTIDSHFDPTEFEIPIEDDVIESSISTAIIKPKPKPKPKTELKKSRSKPKPKRAKSKPKPKKRKSRPKLKPKPSTTTEPPPPPPPPSPPQEKKRRPSPFDILRVGI